MRLYLSIDNVTIMTNIFADIKSMKIDGYTIAELAEHLELPYRTVQKRLKRAGVEPITTGAIYPKDALEILKGTASPGRPSKKPASIEPEPPK